MFRLFPSVLARLLVIAAAILCIRPLTAFAADGPKPASEATREANAHVLESLPFDDRQDFEDVRRGFIAPLPNAGRIPRADGQTVWDLSQFGFADSDQAPDSVNPSLWRNLRLISTAGLFEVTPRIYQVRGADLSNITFIEGNTGLIVMDPCISAEVARTGLELYRQHRGDKSVVAVIYTHSHVDHYGGILGVISLAQATAGEVRIIAPVGFTEEAVSESIAVGNHMSRRAAYMYGNLLPKGARTSVGTGLGLTLSGGTTSLIPPNELVSETGQRLTIDGLTFEFMMAPDSEAPAEMHFYIPDLKVLCPAENANQTLHNIYTLRGAKTRDARKWSGYLQETLELWGDDAQVLLTPHHWPTWGNDRIVNHLKKQRDLYKYLNDQTLRLANHGYNMTEAAAMVELPRELATYWANRGYYGSVSHNVRAVWNYYLGYFDGNPARLDPLPPSEAGLKFVEYMGGADAVIQKARKDFEAGNYRWVAQVLDHVVSADPANQEAKTLLADTLEQLGYQSECAPWRNFYLTGAKELREGITRVSTPVRSAETLRVVPLEMIFDYLAIRLNGPRAAGKKIVINLRFPDVDQAYSLVLENAVLNYGKPARQADATISINRTDFAEILTGESTPLAKFASGAAKLEGNPAKLPELFSLFDKFDLWWNVVTPNPPKRN